MKAWDAKLLAYVLHRRNTVAGLPGADSLVTRLARPASAKNTMFLLEDYIMLTSLMTATILAILPFATLNVAQTADGLTSADNPVGDDLNGVL